MLLVLLLVRPVRAAAAHVGAVPTSKTYISCVQSRRFMLDLS